jgi:fatty acid desaturase
MTKEEYEQLKLAVPPSRSMTATLAVVLLDVAIAAAVWALLARGGLLPYLGAQVLLCVLYFHGFALLHEAGHGNLHAKGWVNDVLGHVFSVFCFLPYYPWKLIHSEHHIWAGNLVKDPALKNLRKARETGTLPPLTNFAWRSWIPLAGFLQQLVFWYYPIDLKNTPGVAASRKSKALRTSAFSVLWLILAYASIAWLFQGRIHLLDFAPSVILYFAMTEMVNLPHHLGTPTLDPATAANVSLPPWEQHLTTRSCAYYPEAISKFVTLNFNYHTEHHLLPRVSWWQLPEVKRRAVPLLRGEYQVAPGLSWTFENRRSGLENVVFGSLVPKSVDRG